ncbi:MAG: hypothetical protein K0S65_5157, partial [Labilithrix sp.]|nr:hypothetical protein [Labilithrix sp.]
MARYQLRIRDDGSERSLVLDAPHGLQSTGGLAPDVVRFLEHFPTGTELHCVCDDGNIRNALVRSVVGPVRVLAPFVLDAPDAWVVSTPELALARARARLNGGDTAAAAPDVLRALEANVADAHLEYARLDDETRATFLDAYAVWRRTKPLSWEILQYLPIKRWRDEELAAAIKSAQKGNGKFDGRGPTVKTLREEVNRRKRSAAAAGDRRAASLAAVWKNPDDDALRLVAADALLEQSDPWGELIVLSFAVETEPSADKARRAAMLADEHGHLFAGPLGLLAPEKGLRFEKGFLSWLATGRPRVSKKQWAEAAIAPQWSTVRGLELDLARTSPDWLTEVMKNPFTKRLACIETADGALRILRPQPDAPWSVVQATSNERILGLVVGFARG